jgi:hypothetical protein
MTPQEIREGRRAKVPELEVGDRVRWDLGHGPSHVGTVVDVLSWRQLLVAFDDGKRTTCQRSWLSPLQESES